MKGGENLGYYTPYVRSCESLGQTAPQGCLAASRTPEVARHRQEPGEIQPGFLRQVVTCIEFLIAAVKAILGAIL